MITLVTCGHTCHMWSHLSHVVTLVKCGHSYHKTAIFLLLKKVSSFLMKTRPTYRPARPQIKTIQHQAGCIMCKLCYRGLPLNVQYMCRLFGLFFKSPPPCMYFGLKNSTESRQPHLLCPHFGLYLPSPSLCKYGSPLTEVIL